METIPFIKEFSFDDRPIHVFMYDGKIALFNNSSGPGVYSLYVNADGTKALKNELYNATGGAGHELSVCAGVVLAESMGGFTPVKDILSL